MVETAVSGRDRTQTAGILSVFQYSSNPLMSSGSASVKTDRRADDLGDARAHRSASRLDVLDFRMRNGPESKMKAGALSAVAEVSVDLDLDDVIDVQVRQRGYAVCPVTSLPRSLLIKTTKL